jgi:hypothetical protein
MMILESKQQAIAKAEDGALSTRRRCRRNARSIVEGTHGVGMLRLVGANDPDDAPHVLCEPCDDDGVASKRRIARNYPSSTCAMRLPKAWILALLWVLSAVLDESYPQDIAIGNKSS